MSIFVTRHHFVRLSSRVKQRVPAENQTGLGASLGRSARRVRLCEDGRMPHDTPLIATIVAGLGLAFVFGTIAQRLKIPPLVGYLFAGVAVGPFTPGYVADQALATELA